MLPRIVEPMISGGDARWVTESSPIDFVASPPGEPVLPGKRMWEQSVRPFPGFGAMQRSRLDDVHSSALVFIKKIVMPRSQGCRSQGALGDCQLCQGAVSQGAKDAVSQGKSLSDFQLCSREGDCCKIILTSVTLFSRSNWLREAFSVLLGF